MRVIEPYIEHLETLAVQLPVAEQLASYTDEVTHALNGQLSKTLRELVEPEALLKAGAFFTGEAMANELVASIPVEILSTVTAQDPSCGGGNLLLALARRLPLDATLAATILDWGNRLYGMDIHPEFVRATRARLILLAGLRGLDEAGNTFFNCAPPCLEEAFPNIVVANSLGAVWANVNINLLNPPFNRVPVPDWCRWATSHTSQAALFVSKCLRESEAGTIIRAILPEVLRSGSNYTKWRRHIQHLAQIAAIESLGQFDNATNVDVFRLTLTVRVQENPFEEPVTWVDTTPPVGIAQTVGDLFSISVGNVVPHRDLEEEAVNGTDYPFLDVHHVEPWETVIAGKKRWRYDGRTYTPPFVVVRRTSRAKDSYRAVGTIVAVNGEQPEQVAVENHLFVLLPKKGTLAECKALLKRLRSSETNDWLNTRMRCRHLTLGSVQSIPWWPNG